jgi:hypothetical protein
MRVRTITFVSIPKSCPPDCECQQRNPERLESLAKHLAQYIKEREREDIPKNSVVRGSAIYLNPPKH